MHHCAFHATSRTPSHLQQDPWPPSSAHASTYAQALAFPPLRSASVTTSWTLCLNQQDPRPPPAGPFDSTALPRTLHRAHAFTHAQALAFPPHCPASITTSWTTCHQQDPRPSPAGPLATVCSAPCLDQQGAFTITSRTPGHCQFALLASTQAHADLQAPQASPCSDVRMPYPLPAVQQ